MPGILEFAVNGHRATNSLGAHGTALPAEFPVLIVGGGPTGLLSAYMLSKLGIKSLIVEKYPERLAAPKAHALSPRSLEICRQFGLDTNALRKLGTQRDDAYWVNFLINLSRERIGVLPYERMDSGVLDYTPEMIHNIPQPAFEQFVADQLQPDPNVEIQKNVAFVECVQAGPEVISTLEERSTKTRWQVKTTHVLACDGAKSEVRKNLAIESEGEDGYETMMTIHFKADLRPVVKERVGMLHWITDPACSGFIIAYDLSGDQVLISNFDSEKHPAESWTQELARTTVSAAIGQDIPFEVLSYRPWLLSRKVAKQYGKGSVFLVGDAAHSFPPTGGLGLNSGIADAHNIVYKIAAVHQGWADSSILNSYEDERRQIALVNSAQSVKNGKKIFSFLKALGTAGIKDEQEARENLHKSVHDPRKQDMIAREVEGQREHFDNVWLFTSASLLKVVISDLDQLELHIGYVYGDKRTPPHASHFLPKFVVGARLPHAWIKPKPCSTALDMPPINVSYVKEFGQADVDRRKFSTLDLVKFDAFTLIAPSENTWMLRYREMRQLVDFSGAKTQLWAATQDFEFVDEDQGNKFQLDSGLSQGGALLVRPDQHILGCLDQRATAEDIASLILGHLGK